MPDTAPSLDQLAREEEELQFPRFDFDIAWALGLALVEAAREAGAPLTVDIRRNGHQLFHAALPGTAPDNDRWIERKTRVVDRFGHSSLLVGERARQQGTTFEAQMRVDPDRYAAHGGAIPLVVRGAGPIGTIAVSGWPQLEDHAFVTDVVRRFLTDTATG
jgi:uncharacterized protein (UPF0303 family)